MKRVLVVDENKADAVTIEQKLLLLGCEVTTVRDGGRAVNRAIDEDYDVAVIDIDMTDTEGVAAVEAIRMVDNDIRIVVTGSGHTDRVCGVAQSVNANGCISKPIDEKQFSMILSAVISGVSCQTCCERVPQEVSR